MYKGGGRGRGRGVCLAGKVSGSQFSPSAALFSGLDKAESYQQSPPAWFLMPVEGQISISSDRPVA